MNIRLNSLPLFVVVASALLSLLACPGKNEVSQHRPRLPEPLRQEIPPEPRPLIGLRVDSKSTAAAPDGKSWPTAFKTITEAINASSGENIYVASGIYKEKLDLTNKSGIRLVGGYPAGALYEKDTFDYPLVNGQESRTILDGENEGVPLVTIKGQAKGIDFLGGFIFQNVKGASAIVIEGDDANNPITDVSIIYSQFKNNTNAGNLGGGVRVHYAKGIRLDHLDSEGNSSIDGGFMHLAELEEVHVSGGTWSNNKADSWGGGLFLDSVKRLTLEGIKIEGGSAFIGGGIFAQNLKGETIAEIEFVGNEASQDAAGGYFFNCKNLKVLRPKLRGNIANSGMGGGLLLYNVDNVSVVFGHEVLKGNEAQNGGVIAIAQNSTNVDISGGSFTANKASENGGAIFAQNTNKLTIKDAQFDVHSAKRGATIYVDAPSGQQTFDSLTVKKGTASEEAGGLYITGRGAAAKPKPAVLISNAKFIENVATKNGGAVLAKDITYPVTINGTLFDHNTSHNFGGALALDGQRASAKFTFGVGTRLFYNTSLRNYGGGAIFVVFNDTRAAMPLPLPENRQLVFYNTIKDRNGDSNRAGEAGTTQDGLYGNFMRISNHDVDNVTAPDANQYAAVFQVIMGGSKRVLEYFVPFSTDPAYETAPWNLMKLDWVDSFNVYTW